MIKILKAKKEIIYIIALLLVVALNDQFLVPLPSVNIFYNYNISQWGLTYDTGFIFRGFLGATLNYFHLIFTDFFIYYSLLAFLVILLIGLFTLIKLYKIQPGIHMFVFVFLIISLPSNIRWWKSYSMFASMDMFIFINSVVIIFLILKLKNEIISTTAGVVISIVSILINEYFIFIYLPIILSLMIYKSFKEKGKVGVVKIILFTFPVMIACIFVFLNGTTEIAPEVLNKMIRENVISTYQVPICYNLAYENLYYKNVIEKIQSSFINVRLKDIIKILITVILLMPSIAHLLQTFIQGLFEYKK